VKLAVVIQLDNEAFQPDPKPELARIFEDLSRRARDGYLGPCIFDINGNDVGGLYRLEQTLDGPRLTTATVYDLSPELVEERGDS